MAKKKVMWAALGVVLAVALAFAVQRAFQSSPSSPYRSARSSTEVSLDEVVAHPDQFPGVIDVAGRVAKVDPASDMFVLGCEDACITMPVRFSGRSPAMGSDVVVRGQIKQTAQGRYLFHAQQVTKK